MPRADASIVLELDSEAQAHAVEAALRPDLARDVPGVRVDLAREGRTLTLGIEAEDEGALRATLNANLRWLKLALEVHRLARGGAP